SMANGLWIGKVPPVLLDLTLFEKLLIARIRVNCCYIRVSSGFSKMICHAIAFEAPIPRVYNTLPPPRTDMDEVLAILFTGPAKPTEKDYARTALLIRRNNVIRALKWLKLNHLDYADIEISQSNMDGYPEDAPIVSVEYKYAETNKIRETQDLTNMDDEDGIESGPCPFAVHG
ncbi:hypothetical protein BDN72DRAFT_734502, partial [Pluteus cervinus]